MKYSSFSPERKREESKRKSVLKGTEVVSQWKFPKDSPKKTRPYFVFKINRKKLACNDF